MKAWQIEKNFGLENLHLTDIQTPKLKPGQVLIKMAATSLNYRDLVTVAGAYGKTVKAPLIPCSDGVGHIVECHPEAKRFQINQRVCPIFFPDWIDGPARPEVIPQALGGVYDGTLGEYMAVDENACVHVPDHLSDCEAASLPCAAVTAWSALFAQTTTKRGDKVVIQGTGGVALFALLLAKAAGAEVLITSSSDDKLAKAKELGADHGVNYRTQPEWRLDVKKIWPDGADHVVELGGAQTLEQSIRSTRIGGHISLIGVLSGANTSNIPLPMILMRNIRIQGVTVGSAKDFERMNAFIAKHKIQPVIDRVFDYADTPAAFKYLESGLHFGKVCIQH